MRRSLLIAIALMAWPVVNVAGELERALQRRWLGAWVVTTVETYSDCGRAYTPNRLNGKLVSSRGQNQFRSGELAKLEKLWSEELPALNDAARAAKIPALDLPEKDGDVD